MVSDNRDRATFRLCPDLGQADDRPLFLQHISLETCHSRQERHYHKCHRCVHAELSRANAEAVHISLQ